MSKRAEEAALKAYPDIPLPHLGKNVIAPCGDLRLAYKEGYEQSEKDTINRAAEYLVQHLGELSQNPDIKYTFVKHFRASMGEA